jgi:Mg2+ and Co2+ transporter CorA
MLNGEARGRRPSHAERHSRFGYPAALILMVLLILTLYVLFRRRQWL